MSPNQNHDIMPNRLSPDARTGGGIPPRIDNRPATVAITELWFDTCDYILDYDAETLKNLSQHARMTMVRTLVNAHAAHNHSGIRIISEFCLYRLMAGIEMPVEFYQRDRACLDTVYKNICANPVTAKQMQQWLIQPDGKSMKHFLIEVMSQHAEAFGLNTDDIRYAEFSVSKQEYIDRTGSTLYPTAIASRGMPNILHDRHMPEDDATYYVAYNRHPGALWHYAGNAHTTLGLAIHEMTHIWQKKKAAAFHANAESICAIDRPIMDAMAIDAVIVQKMPARTMVAEDMFYSLRMIEQQARHADAYITSLCTGEPVKEDFVIATVAQLLDPKSDMVAGKRRVFNDMTSRIKPCAPSMPV